MWRRADTFTSDGRPCADDPREARPRLGDERTTLVEALRCQRLTLELQCAGLEAMARHAVEEYARPMGHVDLLRERIDGRLAQ